MAWSDSILAQRVGGELLVSDGGAPIRIDIDDIDSANGAARLTLNFRVQPSDTPADRTLIDELLGSSRELSAARLGGRLLELVRPSLRTILKTLDPNQPIDPAAMKQLRDTLNRAAFACGFIINEPFVPDLRARRLAVPAPAATRPALAPAFKLHLAASRQLVDMRFDTSQATESDLSRQSIDERLGSIRSLRAERSPASGIRHLVGAKFGAMISGEGASLYVLPNDESTTDNAEPSRNARGVNSVAVAGTCVYASHSVRGIYAWSVDSDEPARLIEPIGGRYLRSIGSRVVWTRGGSLLTRDADHRVHSIAEGATVVAVEPVDDAVALARQDGSISIIDPVDGRILMTAHVGPIAGATPIFDAGTCEAWALLREDGSIEVRSLGLASGTRLRGFSGARAVRAAGGWVAGLSEDGNKVAIWRSDSPQDPWRMIEVASVADSRAIDLAITSID